MPDFQHHMQVISMLTSLWLWLLLLAACLFWLGFTARACPMRISNSSSIPVYRAQASDSNNRPLLTALAIPGLLLAIRVCLSTLRSRFNLLSFAPPACTC